MEGRLQSALVCSRRANGMFVVGTRTMHWVELVASELLNNVIGKARGCCACWRWPHGVTVAGGVRSATLGERSASDFGTGRSGSLRYCWVRAARPIFFCQRILKVALTSTPPPPPCTLHRHDRSSTTAPPSKPRAGTKRPRPPAPATGQSRVKLPPPPPLASASAARGGRENLRQNHNPLRHPLGGGGLGAREATAAGNRKGSVARGAGGVEDQLWPDKHRPRDIACLAVHSKKVFTPGRVLFCLLLRHVRALDYCFLCHESRSFVSARTTTTLVFARVGGWHWLPCMFFVSA